MAIGISTACFYPLETELALAKTGELGADCVEIFINSPHELDKTYIDRFAEIQKQYGLRVKSFHTYASFTESYYYFSSYERRFQESLAEFRRYFDGMHTLGATLLVMHGAKIPGSIPDEQVFERFGILQQIAKAEGLTLCQENVVHYRSESPAYLEKMRDALGADFAMVLDIKQARRTGIDPYVFVEKFANSIQHVHISDYTETRDCVVPFCENTQFDFQRFLRVMREKGYTGDYIIELYENGYETPAQIAAAQNALKKWL